LRSLESYRCRAVPLHPLFAKELAEIISGRALWTMLLLVCPLVGYSFVQAVSLYNEASAAALQSPVLAASLSPLDGILVPTFGSFYVAVTLLFPFVAIRVLGQEKESGALRLLVQLPYRSSTLIFAKLGAVLVAWTLVSIPALSALAVWAMMGGHLAAPETLNLLFGHLLYGLLVGALALFAATISENPATAAIIALAATIGSWVLDFTLAGHSGLSTWIAQLSLTQALRPFEQGLLSAGLVLGIAGCPHSQAFGCRSVRHREPSSCAPSRACLAQSRRSALQEGSGTRSMSRKIVETPFRPPTKGCSRR
jgi:ABC-2 type transport system permease protein